MRLITSNQFHKFAIQSLLMLMIGFSGVSYARIPDKNSDKALADLVISKNKGSELQLEVRRMPLAQVLDTVARKTHVAIHYSVLPEGLVTATCVGSALKQILECLLDRKADIIVRNASDSVKADNNGQAAEAWILGTKLTSSSSPEICVASAESDSFRINQNEQSNVEDYNAEFDQIDELLKKAQSKDPADRAEAMGEFLTAGRNGDPGIKGALNKALVDPDAKVRAKAISSLAHLEGSGASGAIQDALHDTSADVRLKAVDGITNDIAMLQQALNDSDETVRSLASAKIELISQGNGAIP